MPLREYRPLLESARARAGNLDRAAAMKLACDLVWDHFGLDAPARPAYSWIGFYEKAAGDDQDDQMVLVARRDKPACSPIGLHGMCGRGWQEKRAILIPDVATLGANYIACDPKDRSEIVIPLLNADGSCWGVLDGDSYELNGFDENDCAGLTELVTLLKLTARPPAIASPLAL